MAMENSPMVLWDVSGTKGWSALPIVVFSGSEGPCAKFRDQFLAHIGTRRSTQFVDLQNFFWTTVLHSA